MGGGGGKQTRKVIKGSQQLNGLLWFLARCLGFKKNEKTKIKNTWEYYNK